MPDPNAVQTVPTLIAFIVTAVIGAISAVAVAFVANRGDKRTTKGDRVPDVIAILEKQTDDIKSERDYWRDLAWRQVTASEEETAQAFDIDRHPPHRPN